MSHDLDQLLHDTAVVPTDLPEPSELVARGRRRRLRRHAAGTVAGVAAAVLVGVAVLQVVPTGSKPEILDQPPGAGQPATEGSTDGDGRASTARDEMIELERERLEFQIAEIRQRIARTQEGLEQAEAGRGAEEAAALRAELEAQSRALEERLSALLAQQAAVEAAAEAAALRLAVTGSPVLTASGGDPFAWTVTVSPGEDGQLCGDAVFGLQAEDRTGQPCSVVVGPDAVGNELFGSGGSTTNPEGQTLVWGLVDPDVTEVVVELADGSTQPATVAVGGDRGDPDERVAVWAFATEGEVTAKTARAEDGIEERIESSPMPGLPEFPVTLDLPPAGEVAAVHVGQRPVFVVHLDTGEVLVLDAISPHTTTELPKVVAYCRDPWIFTTEDEQTVIETPGLFRDLWHGSAFALDGAWLGGPAPTGLPSYQVLSVAGDTADVGPPGAAPAREVGPFKDVLGTRAGINARSDGSAGCENEYDQTRSTAPPTDPMAVLWHESQHPDRWLYPFDGTAPAPSDISAETEPIPPGEGRRVWPFVLLAVVVTGIAGFVVYRRRTG